MVQDNFSFRMPPLVQSNSISNPWLTLPEPCVRSVCWTARRQVSAAPVKLDHLFLSISTYVPGEEAGENEEMDEGGNGILSSSDSGVQKRCSAAGIEASVPRSLCADCLIAVRTAWRTFGIIAPAAFEGLTRLGCQ